MVKGYEREHDITMQDGETRLINGYDFRFEGIKPIRGPNYVAKQGQFYVTKGGKDVALLTPEKRLYPVQGAVMTEAMRKSWKKVAGAFVFTLSLLYSGYGLVAY